MSPLNIVPLRTKEKRLQTSSQTQFGISTGLHETLNQAPRQLILDHRRHQPSRQSPPRPAAWKYLPEVAQPTGQCRTRHTKKSLQFLDRIAPIPPLAQRRDHQHHHSPINTAPPKQDRWRQHAPPTTLLSAAQTQTNRVSLIKIRGASPRLTQICGVMQRTPTPGQRFNRALFARSMSILCKRTKSDLLWRTSGDIITPAFLLGRSPFIVSAKISEGAPFSFPHSSCLNQTIFPPFSVAVLTGYARRQCNR